MKNNSKGTRLPSYQAQIRELSLTISAYSRLRGGPGSLLISSHHRQRPHDPRHAPPLSSLHYQGIHK